MNNKALKYIILAQIASDAGKGIYALHIDGDENALKYNYSVKENYILRAIKLINTTPRCGINYYITKEDDQNGYPSIVVYFDIKMSEDRHQISFHTPYKRASKALKNMVGNGRATHWDHNIGGSRRTAEMLISFISK